MISSSFGRCDTVWLWLPPTIPVISHRHTVGAVPLRGRADVARDPEKHALGEGRGWFHFADKTSRESKKIRAHHRFNPIGSRSKVRIESPERGAVAFTKTGDPQLER
jgi:hypothetical protein